MLYIRYQTNGHQIKIEKEVLTCFEKVYQKDGRDYMDVFIAVK